MSMILSVRRHPGRLAPALGLALTLALGGCGGSGPAPGDQAAPAPGEGPPATAKPAHDPDDVPITEADVERPADYDDAVTRIAGYRDSIRDDIAAGQPAKAHRALDELDIVLDWLSEIARDGGVPREHWEEVNTAAQELRESFNAVHAQIDAGEDPDFDAVAADVDAALARLQAVEAGEAPADGEAP
jgi:hypothetical protein